MRFVCVIWRSRLSVHCSAINNTGGDEQRSDRVCRRAAEAAAKAVHSKRRTATERLGNDNMEKTERDAEEEEGEIKRGRWNGAIRCKCCKTNYNQRVNSDSVRCSHTPISYELSMFEHLIRSESCCYFCDRLDSERWVCPSMNLDRYSTHNRGRFQLWSFILFYGFCRFDSLSRSLARSPGSLGVRCASRSLFVAHFAFRCLLFLSHTPGPSFNELKIVKQTDNRCHCSQLDSVCLTWTDIEILWFNK